MVNVVRSAFLLIFCCAICLVYGQSYTFADLYDGFGSGSNGYRPNGNVAFDSNGNMFGTTAFGGSEAQPAMDYNPGVIWEFSASGTYRELYDFSDFDTFASENAEPSGVTVDASGNLYGTTQVGGYGFGDVWEYSHGSFQELHIFGNGTDGDFPTAGVTFDTAGNMYGTTPEGGTNGYGMVWEITASGNYLDLHDFGAGADGYSPSAGVAVDSQGDIFGTTPYGGANSSVPFGSHGGMVWEITASGVYEDLHDFGTGNDGYAPQGNIAISALGNVYGTASSGGNGNGGGMVWEVTSTGTYKDLHDFGAGSDGYGPSGVALDPNGNLFGMTGEGGAKGNGMVWEIAASVHPIYEDLYDVPFDEAVGGIASSGVSLDSSNNLYGAFYDGGASYGGMVWELSSEKVPVGSLTLNPATVVGGSASTGTVALSSPAPTNGILVSLSSSSADASVPSSVKIYAGQTSAAFPISTIPYPGDVSATITGRSASSQNAVLWIDAPSLSAVTLNPTTVTGGSSSTGTVTLNAPAPSAGTVVSLASSSADATVPASVTVASGQTSATFTITTTSYQGTVDATITARASVSQSAVLTIVAPALNGLSLNPTTVTGGSSSTGTVTLNGPAPSTGTVISLASSSADAMVPASVTVASGQTSATFTITTTSYQGTVDATITAAHASVSEKATLTIDAPTVAAVSLNPATVTGGSSSTGTVTLNGPAPSVGTVVSLASGSADAKVPATVTVAAGQTSATFTVTTFAVSGTVNATITATHASVSQSAVLTIDAPVLNGLSLNPTTVTGGSSSTGTVTLNGPAPAGGLVVSLSSSSADATVPTSVTVPAGKTSASFTITTITYPGLVKATITARMGSVSEKAVLTIDAG